MSRRMIATGRRINHETAPVDGARRKDEMNDDDKPEGMLPVVETAANAVAAREKAVVEARYIIAMKRPRDMDDVRVRLLKECDRPGFAEVAKYEKPVAGQKIVGLSVRFAEAAIRVAGNILTQVLIVFDDPDRRILRVSVCDLENNVPYESDILLEKFVERRTLKEGQLAVKERVNSTGSRVFLVEATEDDFANKVNAQISKALRNFALRLIPGDILEECSRRIDATYGNKAATDPEGEKKKIIDAFAVLGVKPTQLADYLGHALDAVVPADLASLRRIHQSIRDGETTWAGVMETRTTDGGERPKPTRKSDTPAAGSDPAPSPEEAKPEPVKTAEAPTPGPKVTELDGGSRIVRSAPPTNGKANMKAVAKIYELMPVADQKMGEDGGAKAMMDELYSVTSPTKLSAEEAGEFITKLESVIHG